VSALIGGARRRERARDAGREDSRDSTDPEELHGHTPPQPYDRARRDAIACSCERRRQEKTERGVAAAVVAWYGPRDRGIKASIPVEVR
jgi:hypothetical protein